MRSLLSGPGGESIEQYFRGQVQAIREKLRHQKNSPAKIENLSGYQIASLLVIKEFRNMGVPLERLRSLHAWLQKGIPYGFQVAACGFQVFLMTDLNGRHAIWSDGDFADDLILGAESRRTANIVICLNPIINQVNESVGVEKKEIYWHFFHCY